ncbi:flavodoxin domain-containing protein [uncultured Clostridium sp.]|uniref:flavodoxin domain-containing protein n=1 Tax=uncultured Clostridium sp. TaxID=59620 RepID=UPI0025FC3F8D|nr:flavodoxin domain-containing protein [uncultured Clostridium sp.]
MNNTLIITESHYGTTKKAGYYLSLILGFSKSIEIDDAPESIDKYENIICMFCFYGYRTAEKLKAYLNIIKGQLTDKKVILIGVGIDKTNLNYYTGEILKIIDNKADIVDFIPGDLIIEKLSHEDKTLLKGFFKKNNIEFTDMKKFNIESVINISDKIKNMFYESSKILASEKLSSEINKFIGLHNTCALATGSGSDIRNTPIEYIYYKNNFYFITEGGQKFAGILKNPNVSIAIYDNYKAMDRLAGLQVTGKSEIIVADCSEYYDIMKLKNLSKESLMTFQVSLNIVKVHPVKFEFMNSDFSKGGYDIKQILNLPE